MRTLLVIVILLTLSSVLEAQTGPGGVGSNDGTSSLKLWYRVDNGVNATGGLVDSWTNSAGISALDVSETLTNRPTLVANAVNGYSEISFNGSNKLVTPLSVLSTTNFVTDQASTFVVNRADNTTQTSCVYTTDPLENSPGTRFSNHIPWAGSVYFDIGVCCADRINVGGLSNLTNYSVWAYDAINTATGKQLYRNGSLEQSVLFAALPYTSHATQRFNIGGNTAGTAGFEGDVTEVIIFRQKINTAQRLIVQNYLAAKYGIALAAAEDLYTMDNGANGNYDHDVAGIARIDATNLHNDSRGTGIVRIFDPTSMDDGDRYFWGHDNGALESQTTDVPAGVQGRLTRVWRGQENGNITNVDIEFDLTNLGTVTATDLRLLIDTDNNGVFATGVSTVSGATSVGGNIYRFSNVTGILAGANSTRRFTLGTINIVQTPLPIDLVDFTITYESPVVVASWNTASELNNDYFTLERAGTDLQFEILDTLSGAGNSKIPRAYSTIDPYPYEGRSYYRLSQTDFDGTVTYFSPKSITIEETQKKLSVFPNPNDGRRIKLRWGSTTFNLTHVDVIDHYGKTLETSYVQNEDLREYSLELKHRLLPGLYILKVHYNGKDEFVKLVVK